jgi:DNA-binding response OmpR family regulator
MTNVLIVEDEINLAKEISNYLIDSNYKCTIAHTYNDALKILAEKEFTIILLDLKLPDGNGLQLIQYLKKKKITSGIIVLSANDELEMRIQALDAGADDFLTKPFHLSELNARLKSLIRRNFHKGNTEIEYNEIKIDIDKKQVLINDVNLVLTAKEFKLLLYFISNTGKVITKEAIGYSIWRGNSDMDVSNEIIYTHVKNLRKKLIVAGCKDYIKSIYGVGYKFDD